MSGGDDAGAFRARWSDGRLLTASLAIGIVGSLLFIIGVVVDTRQALASYLFAYVAAVTLAVGALIQVMMSHVTGARWFTVLRRLTLLVPAALPALALLALPILFGVHELYSWSTPASLPREVRDAVVARHQWLSVPFFSARAVIYIAIWTGFGEWLRRCAARRDAMASEGADGAALAAATRTVRRVSAGGLVAVGFALTFAAFDWLMSLEPTWYSTIYGVYVFAGGFLGALGLVALLAYLLSRHDHPLAGAVTAEHSGALGKLLITFVIFWGYIAFSQFLIIWIGDIPADASWYVVRARGSWGSLALVIAAGQFALPFVLLLGRSLKRRPRALAAIGAWLVVMHLLDVYWLVLPAFHPAGIHVSWLDVVSLMAVGGLATAAAAWRARGRASLPLGDPYLAAAIRYVEP